jgi:hypothetical protein
MVLSVGDIPVYRDGDKLSINAQVCLRMAEIDKTTKKRITKTLDKECVKEKVLKIAQCVPLDHSDHRSEASPLGTIQCGDYSEKNVFDLKLNVRIPEGGSAAFNKAVAYGVGMRGNYGFGLLLASVIND